MRLVKAMSCLMAVCLCFLQGEELSTADDDAKMRIEKTLDEILAPRPSNLESLWPPEPRFFVASSLGSRGMPKSLKFTADQKKGLDDLPTYWGALRTESQRVLGKQLYTSAITRRVKEFAKPDQNKLLDRAASITKVFEDRFRALFSADELLAVKQSLVSAKESEVLLHPAVIDYLNLMQSQQRDIESIFKKHELPPPFRTGSRFGSVRLTKQRENEIEKERQMYDRKVDKVQSAQWDACKQVLTQEQINALEALRGK